MKTMICALLLANFAIQPVLAADQPPSTASIKTLIAILKTHALLTAEQQRLRSALQRQMTLSLHGQVLSAKQQKILNDLLDQDTALIKRTISWQRMEPFYIQVYQQSFTQKEVNDMTAFYKTDAGQAIVNKMPVVMQHIMQNVMQSIRKIAPQIEQNQHNATEKLKAVGG